MNLPKWASRPAVWLLAAAGVVVIVLLATGKKGDKAAADVPVEAVATRDITVTVDATGTVEPIDLVEVKSKASGQIVKMPVQVGSVVKRGDLLAQIDPTDVRNQFAQAQAALSAANAKITVSSAQKKRAEDLFGGGVITAPEHESAVIDYANARSALVAARTNLDLARQRLEDATVSAPIAGTVLSQPVAVGQVISSATSSVSGGTTLLTMADLRRIRVRVMVSETDIGSVQPGQPATVAVDAFPNRSFQGLVEKVEPQAVVEQSVTSFPVLVSLDNPEGRLLPGMNGEVTILVAQRTDVLAVPMDAVRSVREVPAIATALGLDPDSVRAQIAEMRRTRFASMSPAGDSGGGGGAWRSAGGATTVGGDSTRAGGRGGYRRGGSGDSTRAGGRRWARGDSTRGGFGRGSRGGSGGGFGGAGFAVGGGAGGAGAGGGGGRGGQIVFVKTDKGFEPRLVRLGVSNFDYAQVLDGVREGDQVALLGVAEIQAQRNESMQRIRQRVGSGVPGVGGGGGGGGTRGGGSGGGGGRRSGGGT